MAVPKKRTSVRRKGLRRAGHTHRPYNSYNATMSCPNCQAPTAVHHVCPACGYYRGKQVVAVRVPKAEEEDESE